MSVQVRHYAVWKGGFCMEPVHDIRPMFSNSSCVDHIITIVRGDVTCYQCKHMMGMPVESWPDWSKRIAVQTLDKHRREFLRSKILRALATKSGNIWWTDDEIVDAIIEEIEKED